MAEEKKGAGQDGKDPNAQAGENSQDGKAEGQDGGKHVSKESWDTLLSEKKKEQEEKRKLQAKLDKYEADEKKKADQKLLDDGKLKELVDSKDKEITAKVERIRRAELKVYAQAAGLVDMEYVDLLMKSATFNDQDELTNGEELFKDLLAKKPFLFKSDTPPPPPGTNNAGANWRQGHTFTQSEVDAMDKETREKNWPEILKQMSEGRIK